MAEAATSADEFSDDFIDQLPSKDKAFMDHAEEARHKQQTPHPNGETQIFRPRAYQLEMFEESMKRNVIIAMDTGSGKTHIAVLRIQAELYHCTSEKIVWFLAPTVALCQQQHDVLADLLPAVQIRFLCGADNVDHWSEQHVWDAILHNIRIVISTHQVLLDALSHGFVRMTKLALLVFDEAHHCYGKHPAGLIMQNFYHPLLQQSPNSAPHILGLTASPVIRGKPNELKRLEQNMNAVCRTPKENRVELMKYVNPPVLQKVEYQPLNEFRTEAPSFLRLIHVASTLELRNDPYVIGLMKDSSVLGRVKLEQLYLKRQTYCHDEIEGLARKAQAVNLELGGWATEYFICSEVSALLESLEAPIQRGFKGTPEEKEYLLTLLARVRPQSRQTYATLPERANFAVSPKVEKLMELLLQERSSSPAILIFVKQRVVAAILRILLSCHTKSKDVLNCATFVGTSQQGKRRDGGLTSQLDSRNQINTLDDLRSGKINVVLATTVLEEGIDISACNLVICFNEPDNLKSFIQRRGRARKLDSKLIMMVGEDGGIRNTAYWQMLEAEMIEAYKDDQRTIDAIEDEDEDDEESGDRFYKVEATGALLTFDNAITHLNHFCNLLPTEPYADSRPQIVYDHDPASNLISADIILPISVDLSVRRASSLEWWKTERMARKDAAFETYVALHKAGLINDNLLPISSPEDEELSNNPIEKRPSLVNANSQYSPWHLVAETWSHTSTANAFDLHLTSKDGSHLSVLVALPWPGFVPQEFPSFNLYWDIETSFEATFQKSLRLDDPGLIQESTFLMLQAAYPSALKQLFANDIEANSYSKDFAVLFAPCMDLDDIRAWNLQVSGYYDLNELRDRPSNVSAGYAGIVRDKTQGNLPYIFHSWSEECDPDGSPQLNALKLTKRTDFLHPLPKANRKAVTVQQLATKLCLFDRMPFQYAQVGKFIPSITHRIGIWLLVDRLCETLMKPVEYNDKNLVLIAITSGAANEPFNYQRLEFLGDNILKFCTSVQLIAEHPNYHEGYLSHKKDRIVSNSALAKAAMHVKLDQFIVCSAFSGTKWRPLYNSDLLAPPEGSTRGLSTKVIADVLEALIGAAFLDGGISKALECLKVFFPESDWTNLQSRANSLFVRALPQMDFPHTQLLERLIGYTFQKTSLLVESLTHVTYEGLPLTPSYQRLEFLGDSLLDTIVTQWIFEQSAEHKHQDMHLMRISVVNADFLAFIAMELSTSELRYDLKEECHNIFRSVESSFSTRFYEFMRHSSTKVLSAQKSCFERFTELRDVICSALETGTVYPWSLLSRLNAPKFFSDLVESVLGAVYIDSCGSLAACVQVLEKMGVLPCLRRLVGDGVYLMPPKNELGEWAGARQLKVGYAVAQDEKGMYQCEVTVGDEVVVHVEDGGSRHEIETRAATEAAEILKKAEAKVVED